jgi:KDO2-lipid IV(A) lauroyltransferase
VLLGLATLYRDRVDLRFLVEAGEHPAMDRFLAYVRNSPSGRGALRKGGAGALSAHVARGGVAGLLVDRNVRRSQGGIWAPFFGREARTTPLPAFLARKLDVPIAPLFCLPKGDGRYVLWLAPEPSRDVRTDDPEADVLEITRRLNRLVEEVIRRHPEAWLWHLKRFKSRPREERDGYPAYSLPDP